MVCSGLGDVWRPLLPMKGILRNPQADHQIQIFLGFKEGGEQGLVENVTLLQNAR